MTDTADHDLAHWAHGVLYQDLNLCGCGYVNATLDLFRKILAGASTNPVQGYRDFDIDYLAAVMLTGADLLDHGTSVSYPWITPKGARLLDAMTRLDMDDVLESGTECSDCPPKVGTQ